VRRKRTARQCDGAAAGSGERGDARLGRGGGHPHRPEPWEVATVIVLLASDHSTYMTGEVASVSSQHS
jgi:NAD(P)-dependent dehydrogenase (short-subunit alcohol dehydrogenase family)